MKRLRRKSSVELSVCALIGAAYAGAWMSVSERDEQPHERLVLRVAGQLKHEREGPLRWGLVGDWQIQLRAAGELGAVGTERLAGQQRGERHSIPFELCRAPVAI